MTDLDGTIQEINQAASDLLQTHEDFLLGKHLVFFVSQSDHKAFTPCWSSDAGR